LPRCATRRIGLHLLSKAGPVPQEWKGRSAREKKAEAGVHTMPACPGFESRRVAAAALNGGPDDNPDTDARARRCGEQTRHSTPARLVLQQLKPARLAPHHRSRTSISGATDASKCSKSWAPGALAIATPDAVGFRCVSPRSLSCRAELEGGIPRRMAPHPGYAASLAWLPKTGSDVGVNLNRRPDGVPESRKPYGAVWDSLKCVCHLTQRANARHHTGSRLRNRA
jgi:hypothetical protein